jgi:dolichol kinase
MTATVVMYAVLVMYDYLTHSDDSGGGGRSDSIEEWNSAILIGLVGCTVTIGRMISPISKWLSSTQIAQSLTVGEQRVVLIMSIISFIAWFEIMTSSVLASGTTFSNNHDTSNGVVSTEQVPMMPPSYVLVALTGFIACAAACFILNNNFVHSFTTWPVRLTLNILGPLKSIDWMLSLIPSSSIISSSSCTWVFALQSMLPFRLSESNLPSIITSMQPLIPKSILWLIDFLSKPESNGISSTSAQSPSDIHQAELSQNPKIWGLIYWIVVIVLCSAPTFYIHTLRSGKVSSTYGYSALTSTVSTLTATKDPDQKKDHPIEHTSSSKPRRQQPDESSESDKIPGPSSMSVTVARKWFHLVAIILFVPTTLYTPQLMTLAYAVALCVLMVIETVRLDIPPIHYFYTTFLDGEAKNETLDTVTGTTNNKQNKIIVSHIFLVFGCAAPFWLSNVVGYSNHSYDREPLQRLLSLFGIISIGVGDAMGAVVGKSLGRHRWGRNRRTIEGSVAMFLSMILCGIIVLSWKSDEHDNQRFSLPKRGDILSLLVATSFTTVLEAFTEQLDNLVLPLAGSTILLLFMGTTHGNRSMGYCM